MLCVESSVAMVMSYFMQLYGIDMDRKICNDAVPMYNQ